jgi:hypothetical protein
MTDWTERSDRKPVSFDAYMVLANGRRISALVTNFSNRGCRIECSDEIPIGVDVTLVIGGSNAIEANVRWALPGAAGLRFKAHQQC